MSNKHVRHQGKREKARRLKLMTGSTGLVYVPPLEAFKFPNRKSTLDVTRVEVFDAAEVKL